MDTFTKYPELVTLERRPEILSVRQVVATEKLHGSNFRVFFPEGITSPEQLVFGSRNEVFTNQGFYGGRPVQWFTQNRPLVEKLIETFGAYGFTGGVVVFGEVVGTSVQKGIKYGPDGDVFFRAFDICVAGNFVTYDLFVEICEKVGLARVPEIWRGEPSKEAFDALLEQPSTEAKKNGIANGQGVVSEGVVIRSNPLLRDVFGSFLIIKHKSKKYREATMKEERPVVDTEPLQAFAATYVVHGRVVNALGRLRDAGVVLQNTLQDMPKLSDAIVLDLHKECQPEWAALEQAGFVERQIKNAVTKQLAGVYRELLASEA